LGGEEIKTCVLLRRFIVAHVEHLKFVALRSFIGDQEFRLVGIEITEDNRPSFVFKVRKVVLALRRFGVRHLNGVDGVPGRLIVGGQCAAALGN
jgi:hypothetical protein